MVSDEKSMLLFDDTSLAIIQSESTQLYSSMEELLNYLIYHKNDIAVETSTKIWAEVEKLRGTETYQYILALVKPSQIRSLDSQSFEQSITDLANAYTKVYSSIFIISTRKYPSIKHESVMVMTPEEFHSLCIAGDHKFLEYLKMLDERVRSRAAQ